MISGWMDRLIRLWRERRGRHQAAALRLIKARYHVFRVLLDHNERALEGLAEVDRLLGEDAPGRLEDAVLALAETVLEMADGLNRLAGNTYAGLYPKIETLRAEAEESLARLNRSTQAIWISLDEVTADLRDEAGGKAQPLGTLLRAGLPVPPGGVVLRRACRGYLRQARLEARLEAVLAQAREPGADLEALAGQARGMILASEPDGPFTAGLQTLWTDLAHGDSPALSVRSSASGEDSLEHSFAGQYVSVLGVVSSEGLVQAFKEVLAGAFSPRALAYRARAGRAGRSLDMAVLCQPLVQARISGVLFTLDPMAPDSGRMLLTAVPGLGTQAVSGRAATDLYRPHRVPGAEALERTPAEIAEKNLREVLAPGGGLVLQAVDGGERLAPLLGPDQILELRTLGLRIEALAGSAQDIEWSMDNQDTIWILQARPARLAVSARPAEATLVQGGRVLLQGGVPASPGKSVGVLALARSREDLAALRDRSNDRTSDQSGPVVLALHQSLVDAAALVPHVAGLLVDLGNPLDHLACLAREQGRPMITGLGRATLDLVPGDWVLVDADQGRVLAADPQVWKDAPAPAPRPPSKTPDAAVDLRRLTLRLSLTDAYGPTFSIMECASLHDLVRYMHEKAVLAMFQAGDSIAEQEFSLVSRLKDPAGLLFLIIDLGGGLIPGRSGVVSLDEVLCEPLLALCQGMSAPGLRWGTPPPLAGLGGLVSRSLLDAGSARPLGNPNYALVTKDYLNVNARVDYHFVMIDAVCGANPRANSIRFRFKGGGTARVQRERRALFVETVLAAQEFFTSRQGDMVTAVLTEGSRDTVREKMEMLGRLLGFSRLLDASMIHDEMPGRMAQSFLAGDYALEHLDYSPPAQNGPQERP